MLQTVPLLCAGIGGRMLRGLLEADIDVLGGGFPLVSICGRPTPCKLEDVLGLGGTSTVFRSQISGTLVAVKVLVSGRWAQESLATERQALLRLSDRGVQGVPRIAADVVEGQYALVTCPVGTPMAATVVDVHSALTEFRKEGSCSSMHVLNAHFLRDILGAMRQCHSAGVIHGDPRLSNVVIVESLTSSSAVLIDFGSAFVAPRCADTAQPSFPPREPSVWVSLPYAPPVQLEAYAGSSSFTPEPWHDLFMLATSMYRLFVPWAPTADDPRHALALATFWESLMAPLQASDIERGASAEPRAPATCAVQCECVPCATYRYSPWGSLLRAAAEYDFDKFEVAAKVAVLSSVPDWPWCPAQGEGAT